MAIEAIHEPGSQADSARPYEPSESKSQNASRSGHWIRILLGLGVIAAVVSGAILYINAASVPISGPSMTHTIARGDLVISVTEQGTLESSKNTEIKCQVRGSSTVTWVIPSGTEVKEGEKLVELDTKIIEETLSLQKTNVFEAESTLAETMADLAEADIALLAYEGGRYRSREKGLQTRLAIAESNLGSAQKMYNHSKLLFRRGYVTALELEGNAFTVTQAELELKVIKTNIFVLQTFTRDMELTSMNGRRESAEAKLKADKAGLAMDESRRNRATEELEHCVVRAPKSGLVIYPRAAAWKDQPDITEGGRVTKDQILLIMPEMEKMQIKVGIHESIIDRVEPGQSAIIRLPEIDLEATVSSVATVTRPAGWWTGNVVKYDTIIALPNVPGLKPGMSAEVELVLVQHKNVLKIPVAAVVETENGFFCWVKMAEKTEKRLLQLGDSNDIFIVVEQGLQEGEDVVLNPLAIVEDAQNVVSQSVGESRPAVEKPQSAKAGEDNDAE